MSCDIWYRCAFGPHTLQLRIGLLGPRIVSIRILLTSCIDGIYRLADQLLICLKVLFQTLDILIAQVRKTADIHVIREVVDLDGYCERILLDAFDEVVIVLIL